MIFIRRQFSTATIFNKYSKYFLQVSRHQVLRPDEGEAGPHGGRGGLRLHQCQLRRRVQGAETVDMHSGRIYFNFYYYLEIMLLFYLFKHEHTLLHSITQVELRFQHSIYWGFHEKGSHSYLCT